MEFHSTGLLFYILSILNLFVPLLSVPLWITVVYLRSICNIIYHQVGLQDVEQILVEPLKLHIEMQV
jgi:hypothetical protein